MLKNFSLNGVAILLIIVAVVVIILSIILFVKVWSRGESRGEGKYDVFMIENNELTVLSGIPVRYCLDDIEIVIFSKVGRMGRYTGRMKIMKKGSKFGRTFWFNASAYLKKFQIDSTYEEIELATEDLMKQLRNHGIMCKKK